MADGGEGYVRRGNAHRAAEKFLGSCQMLYHDAGWEPTPETADGELAWHASAGSGAFDDATILEPLEAQFDQVRSRERVRDLAEVFTHQREVDAMLDMIPDAFGSPDVTFLEPACGSGNFLTEVLRRKLGLVTKADCVSQEHYEHRLLRVLASIYGVDISPENIAEARGRMAHAVLGHYQNDTNTVEPTVGFLNSAALILGDNIVCGDTLNAADEIELCEWRPTPGGCFQRVWSYALVPPDARDLFWTERVQDIEPVHYAALVYAYAFIHGAYPTEDMKDMQFDVIVGNPPYQIGANGTTRTMPVYQHFVDRAISLAPKYVAMITPSRWFTGGLGLGDFRYRMLSDRRLSTIVDNPKVFDCFPGVKIRGGVNYFLWDRDHDGDCEFSVRVDGVIVSTAVRDLRRGDGILIRDNEAAGIVDRVRKRTKESVSDWVQPRLAFGDRYRTNFRGAASPAEPESLPVIFNSGVCYIAVEDLERGTWLVPKWKVLIPMASSGDTAQDDQGRIVDVVLGEPIALGPGSICTETYFVAGAFGSALEAENYAYYLASKFARFLVLQRKATQHLTPDRFQFVPAMDMTRRWTDPGLYKHFGLTKQQIAYIEATIKPRSVNLSLDSPLPATHLLGGSKYRTPGSPRLK